jgi:hypothetical protein
MISKIPRLYTFIIAAMLLPMSVTPDSSNQIDVSGIWDLTVTTQQGTAHPSITLRQNGGDLAGTYTGQMGTVDLEGTLEGDAIVFTVQIRFRDVPFVITYRGRVEGDAMQGTVRFGDTSSGKWSAARR